MGRPKGSKNGTHNKVHNICEICGSEFLTYSSQTRRYCTDKCYQESRGEKRVLICESCSQAFEAYESDLIAERHSGKYCSWDCRYMPGRARAKCKNCGESFPITKSRLDSGRGHYCSVECMRTANPARGGSIKRECKNCWKIFYVNPYLINHGYGNFCCRACSKTGENNPQWVGGHTKKYGAEWTRSLRKSIRERDNYECHICGGKGIDVHHIDYDKFNNLASNLITLCHSCHTKTNTDRGRWKKHFTGSHVSIGYAVGKLEEAITTKTS